MADADEIPVSEAEQAFFDAMKALQDVQESQPAASEPTSLPTETAEFHANTNGHEHGESDREGSAAKEEVPEGEVKVKVEAEEDGDVPSAPEHDSAAPSTSSSLLSAAAGATQIGTLDAVSLPVPITRDDITEATPSTPTTPVMIQQQANWNTPTQAAQATPIQKPTTAGKRKRLPQDLVGQLEDRIAEDPRGDVDAWISLIEEHKRKGKFDDARAVYERFFQKFPQAAQQWINYVRMELDNNELTRVEQVFSRSLLTVPNVELWSLYLDYIRRRNNLTNDPSGKARGIISQAYDFVLNNIGCDKEAGRIWQDQIAFVKSAPGTVGGSSWMDQQKMDSLRKVYQKAVTQPVIGVESMWREYDGFEHGLNKMTAKKFLQERSPSFMTARACLVELTNFTRGLRRETLSRLPPAPGCEGDDDWNYQVALWKKWIKWEKDDPVVLAKDDPTALRNRIIYAYKQALMALRFWPEMWFDAAEYCFENEIDSQGMDFLKQGLQANPESTLLTFGYAERLEMATPVEDGEAAAVRKGQIVRKPYDDLLSTLYGHYAQMQTKEREEIEKLEEEIADSVSPRSQFEDDEDEDDRVIVPQSFKDKKINELKEKSKSEMLRLSKVISAVWIDLMRAMRRIQGHGRVNEPLGGSRQIFADARKRGKITSDVYVASALIEYHCYRDPAALKIFERGMKLFPEDEDFALEYLKHLVNINDITNARAMFETFVSKVATEKAQRVYHYFYEYEAHYGDLAQVYKLEKRMAELYPTNQKLLQFSTRYAYHAIDPCKFLPIVSSSQQTRPKPLLPLPPEAAAAVAAGLPIPPPMSLPIPGSAPVHVGGVGGFHPPPPLPPANVRIGSPKRAATDDGDDFSSRARKLPRSDSPVPVLKGAAGRRLNQIKQQQAAAAAAAAAAASAGASSSNGPKDSGRRDYANAPTWRDNRDNTNNSSDGGRGGPRGTAQNETPVLPDAIMYLLSILPGADKYNAVRFRPDAMVALLAGVQLPRAEDAARGGAGGYYGN